MPKLRLQWHHPFSSVVHYVSGGGQSHWPLFPRKARVRGWREQGSGKESKSSLLRSSLCSNSRGKTADLSSPRAPAETRHETIRQSVYSLLGSLDYLLDFWGPPQSVEGASVLEISVRNPYIRLLDVSTNAESSRSFPMQGWARTSALVPSA